MPSSRRFRSAAAIRVLAACLALACSACATLSPAQRDRATAIASAARSDVDTCQARNACAQASPMRQLAGRAFARSTPEVPRHYALILDEGTDALLARIDLLRSATTTIDVQTYIFDEDDAGRLVLEEMLAAARRGVRVRLLMDQLSALKRVETLAALAGAHENLQVRVYNPVLGRARISYPQYLLAAACCWRRLNQRMHTKLFLVDGAVGITGGRNYQNAYYDWDPAYNFRDRDLLVAGPVARTMDADFLRFWDDPRSIPVERLADVGRHLIDSGVPPLPPPSYTQPERARAMQRDAGDAAVVRERLADAALPVGDVRYISDSPDKHDADTAGGAVASVSLRGLIESARDEVLLQTPYLVLSGTAQEMFRAMHERADAPRVVVSTNSLAATDAFVVYALSHKYKRRYLREFGFNIYEYKPFPADAPVDIAATGAELPEFVPYAAVARPDHRALRREYDTRTVQGRNGYRRALSREYAALRYASRRANEPVPLKRAGVRIGMHAKSLVIDDRVGVVGTHNFDPRGDHYNTESAVVIDDPAFARALAASIRRDIAPGNSWTIGRRPEVTPFTGLEYSLAKISEKMPIFDLWPVRYAVSFEFVPGPECPAALSPFDPGFGQCYESVGDFPEVSLGFKSLLTRIFTAFGAGLAPIL